MHEEIEYAPLEAAPAAGGGAADLGRLQDVPVELAVEIGRTRMTIGETLNLRPGSIVTLNRLAGEPVDLLVNGKPIARGEVVAIDEEFGLRVTEVVSPAPPRGPAAAAPPEPAGAQAPAAPAAEPVAEGAVPVGEAGAQPAEAGAPPAEPAEAEAVDAAPAPEQPAA